MGLVAGRGPRRQTGRPGAAGASDMIDGVNPSVADLLAAPVGVALLDRIEAAHREDFLPFEALPFSDPAAVQRGVQQVETTTFGAFLSIALNGAEVIAGPWSPGAPDSLALAYEFASARRPIAQAICRLFNSRMAEPIDLGAQQCWWSETSEEYVPESAFRDFSRVYGNGEFTWDGFWTVTDPPSEIHDDLINAWEMYPGPISRWHLPLQPSVRLWTIDHPSDWVRLVMTYPKQVDEPHAGWELPGANQRLGEVGRLLSIPQQSAVRTVVDRHFLPDWDAVANDFQGVHLSWAGFLTTEGYVSDLSSGGVTMLRYWSSERTLWLQDVFGNPEPLVAPELSGRVSGALGVDESCGDQARITQDLAAITARLGR
jgi:hypothetical protein